MTKKIIFKLCLLPLFFLFTLFPFSNSSAKSSLYLSKTYSSLAVGKSVTYHVIGMRKGQYCLFSSTSPSIASVKKKTGKVIGKKAGTVKINVSVFNKNGRKKKTLSDSITIREPVIPNAGFEIDTSINSWNFRLRLSCNRILLKKEVNQTKLKLTKKTDPSFSVQAEFLSLSSDGKKLTYQIRSKDKKKLCPKNGSKNGTYILSSSSFSKKLKLNYSERISSHSLVGYIYSCKNEPVANAKIICNTANGKIISYSDIHGKYECKNITSIDQITVIKEGFYQKTDADINLSDKSAICQNFILHPLKESTSIAVHVMDKQKKSISNLSVYLLPDSEDDEISTTEFSQENAILLGETDIEGNLLFYQDKYPVSKDCHTSVTLSQNGKKQITYEKEFDCSTPNHYLLPDKFDKSLNYILYFQKNNYSNNNWNISPIMFRFNPNDFITDSLSFSLMFDTTSNLEIQNLSIKSDSSIFMSSNPAKFLYSIFSPFDTNPIYTDEFTLNAPLSTENLTSLQLPVCLNDGNWQIRIQVLNKSDTVIATSPLQPFVVKDHTTDISLTIYPVTYAKFLAYGDYSLPSNGTATFKLYEKNNIGYAYLDTITTPAFQGNPYSIKKTSFFLKHLCPNSTYILCPVEDKLFCKNLTLFSPSISDLHSSLSEAVTSIPLATIFCTQGKFSDIKLSDNSDIIDFSNSSLPAITKEELQTCDIFPNTIVTFSDQNGNYLFSQLLSSPATYSSPKYIVDIYANKRVLITTQDSYQ